MSVPENKSPDDKVNKSDSKNDSQQLSIPNNETIFNLKDNLININDIFETIKNDPQNKNKQLKYPYIAYNKKDKDVFATESSSEEKRRIIPIKKNNIKKISIKKIKKVPKENKEKKLNRKLSDNKITSGKKEKKIEEMTLDETDNKQLLQRRKSCFLIKIKMKKKNENKQKYNLQSNKQINVNSSKKKIISNNDDDNKNKIIEKEKELSHKNISLECKSNSKIVDSSKNINNDQNQNKKSNIKNHENQLVKNDINNNENKDNNQSNNNNKNTIDDINKLNNLNNIKKKINLKRKLLSSAKMGKNKYKNKVNSKKMDLILKKINNQRSLSKKSYNDYNGNNDYKSVNNDYNSIKDFKSINNDYNSNKDYKSVNNDFSNKDFKYFNNDYKDNIKYKKISFESLKNLKSKNILKFTKKYKPEIKKHFIKKSKSDNKLKFPVINSILDDIDGLCKSILSDKKPERLKNYGVNYKSYNKHFGYEYWKENEIRKKLFTPKTSNSRFENFLDVNLNDKQKSSFFFFNPYNPYSLNWTKKIIESDYNLKKLCLLKEDRKIRKLTSLTRDKSGLSYHSLLKK